MTTLFFITRRENGSRNQHTKNHEWTDGFNRFVLRETEPKDIILIKNDKVLGSSNLFYTGISYDNCYFIIVNDVTVGILYVSEISDVEKTSLYIEWIELLAPFRGKGILKQVFKGLVECSSVSTIRLESEEKYFKKYLSVGCEYMGTDENTGLGIFEYRN